jgi:hypothetical protein
MMPPRGLRKTSLKLLSRTARYFSVSQSALLSLEMTWLLQVMPGWTDEDIPSVAQDRAVIPGDVASAVFYLMMADEDLQARPESPAIIAISHGLVVI